VEIVTATGPDSAALAGLRDHAHHARGAFARNTERALRADVVIFTGWCADQQLTALPG
jgi:hypothetical protein